MRIAILLAMVLGLSFPAFAGQEMKTMGCLGIYDIDDGRPYTHYWGQAYSLEGYIVAKPAASQTIYIKSIQVRASEDDSAIGYIQIYKMPGNQMIAGIEGGTKDKFFNFAPDGFAITPSDHLEFYVTYAGGVSGHKYVQAWCHYTDAL